MKKLILKFFIFNLLFMNILNKETLKAYNVNASIDEESFKGEALSTSDKQYVDDLAKKLYIEKSIDACYMNEKGQKFFRIGMVVAFNDTLFIWPYYLETLSENEKKFIIARELLVLNSEYKEFHEMFSGLQFLSMGLSVFATSAGLSDFLFEPTGTYSRDRYRSKLFLLGTYVGSISLIWYLFKMNYLRNLVYDFDKKAAHWLNNVDAPISYLTNLDKEYGTVNSSRGYIFSSVPTIKQRIAKLEKLKMENQKIYF